MGKSDWIPVLSDLAQKAGQLIKVGFESSKTVHQKSSAMDIVTEFDIRVEDLLVEEIRKNYPEHLILGEEQEYRSKGFGDFLPPQGFVWVIDPIDGTLNFASGIPLLAVSIALFYNGEPLAGVVYNPIIEEIFLAQRGRGATLNGQPIQVKHYDSLEKSMVGVSVARRKNDLELQKLADIVGGMRALGTAAIALAYVAAGRLDAYWEKELRLWDIAAGMLIVQEAGGRVVISNHEKKYPVQVDEILAGGKQIEEYIEILRR